MTSSVGSGAQWDDSFNAHPKCPLRDNFFPNQKSKGKYLFIFLMATDKNLLVELQRKAICPSALLEESMLPGFSSEPQMIFQAWGHACLCLPDTFAPFSSIQCSICWAEQPWKERTSHSTNGFMYLVPSFTSPIPTTSSFTLACRHSLGCYSCIC